ncbi:MAG: hypothetical protein R2731_00995 [Nocardioides sp.]
MPTDPSSPFDEVLAQRAADALAELAAATGGAAVCRIGEDRVTTVKRLEGRSTALADLVRRRRQHPDEDPAASLAAVRCRWQQTPRLSPVWETYADAGLESLAELAVAAG